MAPPVPLNVPPSQAGRFKPRKPAAAAAATTTSSGAKKIQTPGLASLEASQGIGGGNTTGGGRGGRGTFNSSRGSGGRFGRGRDGRSGRDGGRGGGRDGRGRFNIPQGKVFFTAAQSTASNSTSGRGGSIAPGNVSSNSTALLSASERRQMAILSSSTITQRNNNSMSADRTKSNEEVVGTLDEGVGSLLASAVPSSVLSSSNNSDYITSNKIDTARNAFERALLGEQQYEANDGFGGNGGKITGMFGADLYDTDTSDDEDGTVSRRMNRIKIQRKTDILKPISLTSLPEPQTQRGGIVDDGKEQNEIKSFQQQQQQQSSSPFVMSTNNSIYELKNEKQSFFLFQFPTSLPPMTMMETTITNPDGTAAVNDTTNNTDELAPVAIPSVQTSTFDNVLSKSISGKIGKIKIYKSGRTVLVFEGPDGQPAVEMKISEGIACGFKQHAVSIDLDNGTFLPIGNVGKTIVVTPDLSQTNSHP